MDGGGCAQGVSHIYPLSSAARHTTRVSSQFTWERGPKKNPKSGWERVQKAVWTQGAKVSQQSRVASELVLHWCNPNMRAIGFLLPGQEFQKYPPVLALSLQDKLTKFCAPFF